MESVLREAANTASAAKLAARSTILSPASGVFWEQSSKASSSKRQNKVPRRGPNDFVPVDDRAEGQRLDRRGAEGFRQGAEALAEVSQVLLG